MSDGTGTTSYSYDSLNRLTGVTDGAGQAVSYGHDLDGNLTSVTYPNGKKVTRMFNAASQLASVRDWLGNTTSFSYDPNGDLTSEAYPNGVTAASVYDNAGQLTSISDTSGATTLASFTYARDNTGLVTSANTGVIPGGNQNYTYTPLSQLASRNGAPFSYDPAGNLTGLPTGVTQAFNAGGELTSTQTQADTSAPALDQEVSADQTTHAAKLTSPPVSTKTGGELLLAFISATGPSSGAQTITAVGGGGLVWKEVARANHKAGTAEVWEAYAQTPVTSATVTATLGSAGQDGSITVAAFTGAAPVIGAHAIASGASKTPAVSLTTTRPHSVVWAAGEDATHAVTVTPASGQTVVHQHADSASHATYWVQDSKPVSAASTAVTVADTLPSSDSWNLAAVEVPSATAAAVTTSYTYSKNGNLTRVAPGNGPATKLTFDQANRLTSWGPATFAYNGDGLLVSKTGTGGASTPFAWDTSGPLSLLLANGGIYFIYGPGGQPIERIQGSTASYLHTDQQGSVRLITSSTGAVIGTYTFTAYGAISSHTGTATSTLQYDSQFTDSTSGLIYLRARYYNPATGQFISDDPMADLTQTPYSYADDNPLNQGDPNGQFLELSALGAAIGGIAGAVTNDIKYVHDSGVHLGQPDWWLGLGESTLSGGLGGAIGGACLGLDPEIAAVCGGLGSAVTTTLDRAFTGKGFSLTAAGESFVLGYAGSELGGELLPTVGRLPSKLTNVWAPSGLNTWRIYGQDFFGGLLPDCF